MTLGRPRGAVVAGLMAVAALAACGSDQDPALEVPTQEGTSTTAPESGTGTVAEPAEFVIPLSGDNEVPPADSGGMGDAILTLEEGQINYVVEVTGVGELSGAHIHEGPAGENGPIVVELGTGSAGSVMDAVQVDQEVLDRIAQNPAGFYVNAHTADYPDGAARGQLG